MKLLAIIALLSVVSLGARCVRDAHIKEVAGTKTYQCPIKYNLSSPETSKIDFENNYCKKCGCHASDHDAK